MPESLFEQLGAAVEAKLQSVTEDNGYSVTLVRPRRPRGRIQQFADFETIIEQADMNNAPEEEGLPDNAWRIRFDVSVFYNVPTEPAPEEDSELEPLDTILNRIWASLGRAVVADPKWGLPEFVNDTEYGDPEFLTNADGSLVCCCLPFTVRMEHQRGDPMSPVT